MRDAHQALDDAVDAVYGFNSEDPAGANCSLNLEIARKPRSEVRGPGASGLAGARRTEYRLE